MVTSLKGYPTCVKLKKSNLKPASLFATFVKTI